MALNFLPSDFVTVGGGRGPARGAGRGAWGMVCGRGVRGVSRGAKRKTKTRDRAFFWAS